MAAPAIANNLRLGEAVKGLPVQHLVAQLEIEALTVTVLPGGPRLNVGGLRADGGDLLPRYLGNEFLYIVGPYMIRHAAQDEEIGRDVNDVGRSTPLVNLDCQALPAELVDDIEHGELPSIMGPGFDKVLGPDMFERALPPEECTV